MYKSKSVWVFACLSTCLIVSFFNDGQNVSAATSASSTKLVKQTLVVSLIMKRQVRRLSLQSIVRQLHHHQVWLICRVRATASHQLVVQSVNQLLIKKRLPKAILLTMI
ncbi:KxYKxGKxW signal peptide domain-containing protein [Lacticaseibacillus paracasei]|uniref:KxYKxGKxW signal peptide domain-containing protein n=1 Tax=Lacticaseibacillus paracasei TaxID=1597 RepID=UPI00387315E1